MNNSFRRHRLAARAKHVQADARGALSKDRAHYLFFCWCGTFLFAPRCSIPLQHVGDQSNKVGTALLLTGSGALPMYLKSTSSA